MVRMRAHDLQLDMILRGIIMSRGDAGATIAEIRLDYFDIVCEPWPLKWCTTDDIIRYLMQIDGLMMEMKDDGLCIWYIDDIGFNVSERAVDSNNNIIVIDDTVVATETTAESSQQAPNNSYAIPPPRVRRITTSASAVANMIIGTSAATSLITTHRNRKRHSTDLSTCQHPEKQPKLSTPGRLPLLEENLDIHNRHSGAIAMAKKVTSTEIESSICIQSETTVCAASNDYIAPIKESNHEQLAQ